MIVRLKEQYRKNDTRDTEFQFYDSPIKSAAVEQRCYRARSFNSMIVRLKGFSGDRRRGGKDMFQFYDSPIKRANVERAYMGKAPVSIL